MKVSLNWLREFVDPGGSVEMLTDLLTFAGVEVEGVAKRGCEFEHVVVAQILSSAQHPNADRLSVCQADDGSGTPRQIVCGAKNYNVGDKVPLALPGAVLPGGFKIQKGKLRGEVSEGMMCSAKELELAEDADGLLILPPESRVGAPIGEVLRGDTVIELEVTPNRPDLLSHIGIAREIAALTAGELRLPPAPPAPGDSVSKPAKNRFTGGATSPLPALEKGSQELAPPVSGFGQRCGPGFETDPAGAPAVDVRIEDPEKCPHYTAQRVRGVTVGPSPAWLAGRLEAVGLRPINNIVDITNYVLLETGQPLHAFDAAKLHGGIRVRAAAPGEEFSALDGRTYPLDANDLVIADGAMAVALAGVMGGEDTGVTAGTTDVVIESAFFQPRTVRRTSRRLGLVSDSSYRFERRVDPAGVVPASNRAVRLILDIAGGEVCGGLAEAGAAPVDEPEIVFRYAQCSALVGTDIPADEADRILGACGLVRLDGAGSGSSRWRIPSFRPDLRREVDLIEEVIRVYGIDRVPARMVARFTPESESDAEYDFALAVGRVLVGGGFYEARTLTLVPESQLEDDLFGAGGILRIRNPLGEDSAALRPSLIPGLIQAVARNIRYGAQTVSLFEIGRVFRAGNPEERRVLALAMTGLRARPHWRQNAPVPLDFFDLKGIIAAMRIEDLAFDPVVNAKTGLCLAIRSGDRQLGFLAQVSPARARALDVTAPLLVAEIDLEGYRRSIRTRRHYSGIARFPAVTRDIAMIVPADLPQATVDAVFRAANEPLLENIELFDVFSDPEGKKVPAGYKSLAYSLTYRSREKTLDSAEVAAAHDALKARLISELQVELRE